MITYFSLIPIEHKVSTSIGDKVSHFIAYLILFIIAKKVHTKSNYSTCAYKLFIEKYFEIKQNAT
jgi:hypothetical protein